MAPQEPTFESLIEAFEAASTEYNRLNIQQVHPPEYAPNHGFITLDSVERLKAELATYAFHAHASAAAEQALNAAKAALDAWFPAQVAASLADGTAMTAPSTNGVIVLVKHQGAYIIERGLTQEEALNKIERFLNQF